MILTKRLTAAVLLLLFFSVFGNAIEVQLKSGFDLGKSQNHLGSPFQFSNGSLCFSSQADSGGELTFLCSFDEGKTFSTIDVSETFCGANGTLIEGELVCPLWDNMTVEESQARFPAHIYTSTSDGSIQSSENGSISVNFKRIGFVPDNFVLEGGIYNKLTKYYFSTVTFKNVTGNHSLFVISPDGFHWDYASDLPFTNGNSLTVVNRGFILGVAQKADDGLIQAVYSRTYGQNWIKIRKTDSSVMPQAVSFSSGLAIESFHDTNVSSLSFLMNCPSSLKPELLSVTNYHNDFFSEKQITDSSSVFLLGIFPLSDKNASVVVIVYEVCASDSCERFSLKFELDDSKEVKSGEENERNRQRLAEERKMKKEKELEKKRKAKEEQIRIREEMKKRFDAYDEKFITSAKEFQALDGEMVIVRSSVVRNFVEFEKERFLV